MLGLWENASSVTFPSPSAPLGWESWMVGGKSCLRLEKFWQRHPTKSRAAAGAGTLLRASATKLGIVYLPFNVHMYMPIHSSPTHSSSLTHPSIHPSIIHSSIHPFIHSSIYHPTIHLFIHHPPTHPSFHHPSIYHSSIHPWIIFPLSINPFTHSKNVY